MKILNSITELLKNGLQQTNVQPEVKVDFHKYSVEFKEQKSLQTHWESLVKEIKQHPESILKSEWKDYDYSWERQECFTIEIDGIVIKLYGVMYPMPGNKPSTNSISYCSQVEYANRQIDQQLSQFINALSQASDEKKRAVYSAVSVVTNQTITNNDLIEKVTASVIQSLILKKVIRE